MMSQSTSYASRRRDKPILSCSFCRARKLRCDRQTPCGACIRRSKPAECIYSSSEQERKNAIDYRPHTRGQQARQRINRLENLVSRMRDMSQESSKSASVSSNATHDESFSMSDKMAKLNLTADQAVYIGSSHWATILEEIRHLKDELPDEHPDELSHSQTPAPNDAASRQGFLFAPKMSLLNSSATCFAPEQILAMVPPRQVVDRHISHFFNAFDLAPVILHRNRFLAEYTNFWRNPSATPIMWVGLLFSVMTMSAFLQQQHNVGLVDLSTTESSHDNSLETYRSMTIHCLFAGDYLRPSKYTIETLTLHFGVNQNVNLDTEVGDWILIGVIIRLALRMGLHRDPSHWPNIRPLQAELRRRLWMTLYHMDFFTSTQVGLPRIIKDSQCDTRPPAHLCDQDLGFEGDEIPPERPLTEPTTLLYIIQRDNIIKVAAEIYDATEAASLSPAAIAMLGSKLDRAIDSIPEWLKYRPLETSIADNPTVILNRMVLDILVNKAIYLLNRREFMKFSSEGSGEHSAKLTDLCINAALAILTHQQKMNEEGQPGGLMSDIRWKISTALNHEFLQATMMLCLALSRINGSGSELSTIDVVAKQRRDEILRALLATQPLWERNADRSTEARKATQAITTVLKQAADRLSGVPISIAESSQQIPGVIAPRNFHEHYGHVPPGALDLSAYVFNDDLAFFGDILDSSVPDVDS